MDTKISPECRARAHGFCVVRWKEKTPSGLVEHLCDCAEGACRQNADAIAELQRGGANGD